MLFLGWMTSLLVGCGSTVDPKTDAIADAALRDSVLPPDLDIDDGKKPAVIGQPCDPTTGEYCGGAVCLDVGLGVGVCARPGCKPEDLTTPAVEDDCPEGAACASVPIEQESGESVLQTFCLPRCKPEATSNPCAAIHRQLACDPLSLLVTGHTEVCLLPACTASTDCGNRDPIKPDAQCDLASGLCFNTGNDKKAIGDPCKTGKDCGPRQYCLTERRIGDAVKVTGGYCTIIGCKYRGPWECPGTSTCFGLGSQELLTICLATGCEPTSPPESDGCRDEAPAGQYDCIDVDSQGVCWLDITP